MSDHDHLLACWPTNYVNGDTHKVASWCGWTFDEAMAKLMSMADAGLIKFWQPTRTNGEPACYRDCAEAGKPIYLWSKPDGAHGLMPVEDPRLLALGITRAVTEGRRVIYQGSRPLDVYRVAKREGLSMSGYSLDWSGPDPVQRPQLEIPIGVVFEE